MRDLYIFGLALLAAPALASPAHAEMKDWQLRRLLNFKTECQMDDFVDKSGPAGPGKFHAICRNITFYPDGIDLECPERTNEWTCRILTKPLEFGHIDMLGQGQRDEHR